MESGAAHHPPFSPRRSGIQVKVCGITRLEDALLAVRLGAAAIGFNCWRGSPRWIAPAQARAIGQALPAGVARVGVFVDATVLEIERIAAAAGLTMIQLHGDETPALGLALRRPILRAFRKRAMDSIAEMLAWPAPAILLDAAVAGAYGGTGRAADWSLARALARRRALVLAGGLGPANLALAIAEVRPAAVDLNSGVESAPGIKDHALLRASFELLREIPGAPSSTAGAGTQWEVPA
jgi:phosphoribosylanthranilate isomerase